MMRLYHTNSRPVLVSGRRQRDPWQMGRLALIAILAAILVLIAGGVFLSVWEPEPPRTPVEKQIPDERFPR
jgi:hypothetical protein